MSLLRLWVCVFLVTSSISSFPIFPVLHNLGFSTHSKGGANYLSPSSSSNHHVDSLTINSTLNLSVSVELSVNDLVHLPLKDPVANKRLKLVIRWLHPTSGEPPEGYNIEVRAIPSRSADSMDGTPQCTEHFADFFHHVERNEQPVVEIGSGTTKSDYLIQFGCSYYVSIQASPIVLSTPREVVNITVPTCVDGVCGCTYLTRLPKPEKLTARVIGTYSDAGDERSYLISWSYPTLQHPENVTLTLRIEQSESVLGLSAVYRNVKEFRHKLGPGLNFFQQEVHHLGFHSSYRARVNAFDSHYCEGHVAEIYISGQHKVETNFNLHKETIVSALVLGASFLVVIALVIGLSWRRFLRRLHVMAASTAASTHPSARYCRSPQTFQRDSRRTTSTTNELTSTCQNLVNLFHGEKGIDEPRSHLLGTSKSIDDYEIDPCQLKLGVEIGKGAFGRVHLATVDNLPGQPGPTLVAVKQIKKKVGLNERDDFLAEIAMMKRVGRHENIVVMLACVTLNQPYSMVLEYVPYGDLLHYLRTLRTIYHQSKVADKDFHSHPETSMGSSSSVSLLPRKPAAQIPSDSSKSYNLNHIFSSTSSQSTSSSHSSSSYVIPNYYRGLLKAFPTSRTINTEELHDFARQIARGMEHLELKGITHRDLAARNLLVSEGRVLKISDFGLSRHGVYVNTRTRMLPLRWLAIESMTDNLYSSLSDVWAFGVVLWEICTLGGFPYANVADAQLMTYLLAGNRLTRPENVSEKLYQLMLQCWSAKPDDRPTFRKLRSCLEDFESQHETYVDFSSAIYSSHALPPTEEDIS